MAPRPCHDAPVDFDHHYRAVQSRDPRFDGWFFTAVTTTGIYCRPSCPARTPAPEHVRFYPSAAAAQQAGFRACLRCRPDAVPGSPEWNVRADVVARAMRLIADGVVDREGVGGLAVRLGYGVRHLHRMLVAEVGAGALALARAQRMQSARILIETTSLPMVDVAFAAGFQSVRQFNDTVRDVLARTPSELRKRAQAAGGRRRGAGARAGHGDPHAAPGGPGPIVLRLPYRKPMAAAELLGFLGARAVPGVEAFAGGTYSRTLRLPHGHGTVALSPEDGHVGARLVLQDLRDLGAAVARCRRLLDLDADPEAVDASLAGDPMLRPLVLGAPGRRLPGTVDGFELAVRAVIGQQVSVAGARTVVGRLVDAVGPRLALAGDGSARTPTPTDAVAPGRSLDRVFPSPSEVVDGAPGALAMPAARRSAVRQLASAVAEGSLVIDPGSDPEDVRRRLVAQPGIGAWTASYIAMRALGDPDAFMPTDLGIVRGLERLGCRGGVAAAVAAAERWRPWRAYAMTHLWALDTRRERTGRQGTPREKGRAA
jgi:AraC family transcriptional regulator, regulatory protein of adaptative response / DNA-3-methyladenine glycosylase II